MASDTDDTLAVISLVCAIVGFMAMPVILSILAIVLARIQLKRIEEDPERYGGKQIAQIGFWIGIIRGAMVALVLLLTMLMMVFLFIIPLIFVGFSGA